MRGVIVFGEGRYLQQGDRETEWERADNGTEEG